MVTVEFHRRAVFDANISRRFYQRVSNNLASRFVAELRQAFDEIGRAPLQWSPHIHGTRCYLLHSFPFSIVYIVTANGCRVIAVAHQKRRPDYWKRRLPK